MRCCSFLLLYLYFVLLFSLNYEPLHAKAVQYRQDGSCLPKSFLTKSFLTNTPCSYVYCLSAINQHSYCVVLFVSQSHNCSHKNANRCHPSNSMDGRRLISSPPTFGLPFFCGLVLFPMLRRKTKRSRKPRWGMTRLDI